MSRRPEYADYPSNRLASEAAWAAVCLYANDAIDVLWVRTSWAQDQPHLRHADREGPSAEAVAEVLPEGTPVVNAFNNLGFGSELRQGVPTIRDTPPRTTRWMR